VNKRDREIWGLWLKIIEQAKKVDAFDSKTPYFTKRNIRRALRKNEAKWEKLTGFKLRKDGGDDGKKTE